MPILGLTVSTWVLLLLAAAAGGALGAAIGALPSLSLAGIAVMVGELAGGGLSAGGPAPLAGVVGLGPLLGPHTMFAGGVAGAAYAARKGYLDTDFEYYEAKNVTHALGPRPDVVTVGAAFGAFGFVVFQAAAQVGLPLDPIFLSVVVSAFVHRLALGYPILGPLRSASRLDMSSFDRSTVASTAMGGRALADGGAVTTHADRLTVEPWLPHQYEWSHVAAIGVVAGVGGAYLAVATGSVFLAFGLSAASLLFLAVGVQNVPVTHHITLPASAAALAFLAAGGGGSPPVAIVVGAVFGLVSALVAELAQRVLYAHADTHFDPAAVGIAVTTLLVGLLATVGVFSGAALWFPV